MGRTTFESSVRSRGGRREDDGVSPGGMVMSLVFSARAGVGTFPLKIGSNPLVGEDVVLPKGAVIINFQRLSAADSVTGSFILISRNESSLGPDRITFIDCDAPLGNSLTIEYPDGAVVDNDDYRANGLAEDTQLFSVDGGTAQSLPVAGEITVGVLNYFIHDDGTSGTR